MGQDTGFGAKYANEGYLPPSIWKNIGAKDTLNRTTALRAVLGGDRVIYAMRLADGIIKIGCTKNLAARSSQLRGQILGFRRGGFDEELAIHESFVSHRARPNEYYHPHPEIMAFVNELRDEYGLPHIAA